MRSTIRARHYSPRTEKAYIGWAARFLAFCEPRPVGSVEAADVARFLTHLATRDRISASTQNQAFSALLFLLQEALGREVGDVRDVVRAKRPVRVPLVLSRGEVATLLGAMQGTPRLMAQLMYGSGLRLLECCRLRAKDVDFARHESNPSVLTSSG
jgi:site-specific recombinase XerD